MTIREVVAKYLAMRCKHFAEETQAERTAILGKLADDIGDMDIGEAKPIHLLGFLDKQTDWKRHTTRAGRTHRIISCFSWAQGVGIIEENPFNVKKVYDEFIGSRDLDCGYPSVSDADFATFMEHCKSIRLKRAVLFLRYTGARPIEMRRLVWSHWKEADNVLVQHVHKTMKKSGKPRTIHVTQDVADLLNAIRAEQMTTDPERHVFVNDRGRPLSRQCFNSAVRRVARKSGIPQRVTPYGAGRVAFIERAILANVHLKQIAELVGHSTTTMCDQVYARRIGGYHTELRNTADQIMNAPLARRAV